MTTQNNDRSRGETFHLLDTQETAEFLGMSVHWVKASRHKPELNGPSFLKIGRTVKYDIRDLETWLDSRRFRGTYEMPQSGGAK